MSGLHEAVGARIRELREAAQLTQRQLADSVGLTRSSIANIEAGRQGDIGITMLAKLADALDTTVAGLVGTAPETVRINRAEARIAVLEDQVGRLVGVLNAAAGALGAFELVVRETRRSQL